MKSPAFQESLSLAIRTQGGVPLDQALDMPMFQRKAALELCVKWEKEARET